MQEYMPQNVLLLSYKRLDDTSFISKTESLVLPAALFHLSPQEQLEMFCTKNCENATSIDDLCACCINEYHDYLKESNL